MEATRSVAGTHETEALRSVAGAHEMEALRSVAGVRGRGRAAGRQEQATRRQVGTHAKRRGRRGGTAAPETWAM